MSQSDRVFPDVCPPAFEGYLSDLTSRLSKLNVFYAAQRSVSPGTVAAYYAAKVATGQPVLIELTFRTGVTACKVTVRSASPRLSSLAIDMMPGVLSTK